MRHGVNFMEPSDFSELLKQARQLVSQLKVAYKEVAGEDLDLEEAVRDYPLLAITLAAGVGALAGWLVARRMRPTRQPLQGPPPAPQSRLDRTLQSAREIGEKLKERRDAAPEGSPPTPLDYLETLLPERMEKAREILPEGSAEEAAARAREWLDTRVEPALQHGLERAAASKFGVFLRQTLHRIETTQNGDTELPDPGEAPEK
jgi:hypothetical protein